MGINKDHVGGRAQEGGGKIQEEAGKLVGNKTQEFNGKVNKTVGAGQANMGDMTENIMDANKKP